MPAVRLERRHGKLLAIMELPVKLRDTGIEGLPRRRFVASTEETDPAKAKKRAAVFAVEWQAKIDAALGEADADFYRRRLASLFPEGSAPATRTVRIVELSSGRTISVDEDTGTPHIERVPEASPGEITFANGSSRTLKRTAAVRRVGIKNFAKELDDWPRLKKLQPKQTAMYRSDIEEFAQRFPAIEDVNGPDVKAWTMELAAPSADGTPGLTTKTIQRKLAALRGYWKHLRAIDKAPDGPSPFADLDLPRDSERDDADDKREAFTVAEVLALLKAARWGDGEHEADSELADVIEVARWTGARRQSICALKIADVHLDAEIPYLSILKDKSKAGRRDVPIHARLAPTLRRLIGERKGGFLFPDLETNKYGDRSNGIGNRFGRLKTRLGFSENHVFHSIRKTVATLLENAGVPENVAADIVGHKKKTMTYGLYSSGTSLALKHAAIKKLSYGKES